MRHGTSEELTFRGATVVREFGTVVDAVDLVVGRGELVVLVGENGAGKSTLVKAAAGVVPLAGGTVGWGGRSAAEAFRARRLGVVWQDLALCDNLTVAQNLFLGREAGRGIVDHRRMRRRSAEVLDRLGLGEVDPQTPIGYLSTGQRQLVAIARTLLEPPPVLILDEPTSSLGPAHTDLLVERLRALRGDGHAILFVTHRIEESLGFADRIAVLRRGRLVADRSPVQLQVGDVLELMSGVAVESVARRNLAQMSTLLDQLAMEEPVDPLPAIVSGFAAAAGQRRLALHLRDEERPDELALVASVGLPERTRRWLQSLPLADDNGVSRAVRTQAPVTVDDLRGGGPGEPGPASMWAVPIQGSRRTFGALSGFADVPGRPREEQLQLASLYAGLAASAIERRELLVTNVRRNRVLEAMRDGLELLAGPAELGEVMAEVLRTLAGGLGADAATLVTRSSVDGPADPVATVGELRPGAAAMLDPRRLGSRAGPEGVAEQVGESVVAVRFSAHGSEYTVAAAWGQPIGPIGPEDRELIEGTAWSLKLAQERAAGEAARAESAAARRTGQLQREFIGRLSHELRTPLTAIRGYASSLGARDVRWDDTSRDRFLGAIGSEAARMQRLVRDLLDHSTIESGMLSLRMDWCDLPTVLDVATAPYEQGLIEIVLPESGLPPVWADHDRLQQVLTNLLDNALNHGAPPVTVSASADTDAVVVEVADHGPGVPADIAGDVFRPYVRTGNGAGLGLAICRSIAEAHGGTLLLLPERSRFRLTVPLAPADAEG